MNKEPTQRLFTIDNVLSDIDCQNIIDRCNKKGWNDSSPSGGGHGRTGKEDARTNKFCVFHDDTIGSDLYDKIASYLPENLTCLGENIYFNEDKGKEWEPAYVYNKIRVYKYDPGEEFPEHIDYKVKKETYTEDGYKITDKSFFSLLIYLNHDFVGGKTGYWTDHKGIHCRFLRDEEKQGKAKEHQVLITPKTGMAVIQDQDILHEGLPTTKGTKYILRTDIIHRRKLKLDSRVKVKPHEGEWERLFETSCKNYAD